MTTARSSCSRAQRVSGSTSTRSSRRRSRGFRAQSRRDSTGRTRTSRTGSASRRRSRTARSGWGSSAPHRRSCFRSATGSSWRCPGRRASSRRCGRASARRRRWRLLRARSCRAGACCGCSAFPSRRLQGARRCRRRRGRRGRHDLRARVRAPHRPLRAARSGRARRRARARVRGAGGQYVFSRDERTTAELVVDLLRERGLTLATAESCTGGLVATRITDVPGSSDVFVGSIVAYANEVKRERLGVPEDVLATHGAVSPETAAAMAVGAREALGADVAVSVTGVAGPGGGTDEKPVGLVYLHAVGPAGELSRRLDSRRPRDDPPACGGGGVAPRSQTCHEGLTNAPRAGVAWRPVNGSGSSVRSTCPTRLGPGLALGYAERCTTTGGWYRPRTCTSPSRSSDTGLPESWRDPGRASCRRGRRPAGRAAAAPLPRDAERRDDCAGGRGRERDNARGGSPGTAGTARRLPSGVASVASARHGFAPSGAGRRPSTAGEHLFDSCRPVGSLPFFARSRWSQVRRTRNGSPRRYSDHGS